jgi:hypothetical protein
MAINPILRLAQTVDRRLRQAGDKSPGVRRLSKLFEVIHFTSPKTEEGKTLQLRIALVDPTNPDPDGPPLIRPDRWTITILENRIPLTVPSLIKLSKAADPWSSTLAVFYDSKNEFFVWGMIDQTVHFNTMLVRETEFGGYMPPGAFQVSASGTADLSIYHGFDFVARLQQDQLLTRQSDVFWSGPIHDLSDGIAACFADVGRTVARAEMAEMPDPGDWLYWVVDTWTRTLCRLLISVQRYRHGGALLITRSHRNLDIKYKMNYARLPRLLSDFAAFTIQMDAAGEELRGLLDVDADDIPALTYLDESIAEGDADDAILLRQSKKRGIRNFTRRRNPSDDAGREPPLHVGKPESALLLGDGPDQTTPKKEKATNRRVGGIRSRMRQIHRAEPKKRPALAFTDPATQGISTSGL